MNVSKHPNDFVCDFAFSFDVFSLFCLLSRDQMQELSGKTSLWIRRHTSDMNDLKFKEHKLMTQPSNSSDVIIFVLHRW